MVDIASISLHFLTKKVTIATCILATRVLA
jgi:hypothetical protein